MQLPAVWTPGRRLHQRLISFRGPRVEIDDIERHFNAEDRNSCNYKMSSTEELATAKKKIRSAHQVPVWRTVPARLTKS